MSCQKDESISPDFTGTKIESRTPECPQMKIVFDEIWEFDFEDWFWPCLNEPIDLHFVGHYVGKAITSSSCNVNANNTVNYEAVGIGLISGDTYTITGKDHWVDHFGVWDTEYNRATFFRARSVMDVVNENTGQTYENLEAGYRLHINANGTVIADYFGDFTCPE